MRQKTDRLVRCPMRLEKCCDWLILLLMVGRWTEPLGNKRCFQLFRPSHSFSLGPTHSFSFGPTNSLFVKTKHSFGFWGSKSFSKLSQLIFCRPPPLHKAPGQFMVFRTSSRRFQAGSEYIWGQLPISVCGRLWEASLRGQDLKGGHWRACYSWRNATGNGQLCWAEN